MGSSEFLIVYVALSITADNEAAAKVSLQSDEPNFCWLLWEDWDITASQNAVKYVLAGTTCMTRRLIHYW